MIIEAIKFSNSSGNYDIYHDNSYVFRGQRSLYFNIKDILLLKEQEVYIWARYKFVNPFNYIPFLNFLGFRKNNRKFIVYDDLTPIATFSYETKFHKSRYKIVLSNSDVLYAYIYYKKGFYYLSIYKNVHKEEKQIALVEKQIHSSELNQKCKFYLLDEYKDLANVLSIFLLYFEGKITPPRIRIHIGPFGGSVSMGFNNYNAYNIPLFNSYSEKYNPTWREVNFPNENFWGPINIENN